MKNGMNVEIIFLLALTFCFALWLVMNFGG